MGCLAKRFRLALVTGGSSGIGRAIVRALDAEGIRVIATSRDAGRIEASGHVVGEVLELSELGRKDGPERLRNALDAMVVRHGVPDLLVNNAGFGCFGFLQHQEPSRIEAQLSILLHAPIAVTRHLLPGMMAHGGGAVVNVSSLAAELPMPGFAVYDAAKAGLAQFTRGLMVEADGSRMQFIDFRPGDFKTPFNRSASSGERELSGVEARVWKAVEDHLNAAPGPEMAARSLVRALGKGRSGTVRTGTFFQARLAVAGAKLVPFRIMKNWIRRYYRIGRS